MGKKQTVRNYVATSTNGANSDGHVTQGDWLSSANLQAIFNCHAGSTKQLLSLCHFLNQARASQRPVHAWFLEILFVREVGVCVCVCVCVSAPEGINNYSREMNP